MGKTRIHSTADMYYFALFSPLQYPSAWTQYSPTFWSRHKLKTEISRRCSLALTWLEGMGIVNVQGKWEMPHFFSFLFSLTTQPASNLEMETNGACNGQNPKEIKHPCPSSDTMIPRNWAPILLLSFSLCSVSLLQTGVHLEKRVAEWGN